MYTNELYTRESLFSDLEKTGMDRHGTLVVHSSFKSIGRVEGGPSTVLDALSDYMKDGLLVMPTNTYATVNANNPRFIVEETPSCVGILTEMFRKRPGVVRSLHPTHSVAAWGRDAEEFVFGDHYSRTPCGERTTWRKLLECKAAIMLIGVDLRRNTFIHGVEEWAGIPGRLNDKYNELITVLPDGTEFKIPMTIHSELWSDHYWKVNDLFIQKGIMKTRRFGMAETRICDAVKMAELLFDMLRDNPDLFSNNKPL